jgi:hypothetical protein
MDQARPGMLRVIAAPKAMQHRLGAARRNAEGRSTTTRAGGLGTGAHKRAAAERRAVERSSYFEQRPADRLHAVSLRAKTVQDVLDAVRRDGEDGSTA